MPARPLFRLSNLYSTEKVYIVGSVSKLQYLHNKIHYLYTLTRIQKMFDTQGGESPNNYFGYFFWSPTIIVRPPRLTCSAVTGVGGLNWVSLVVVLITRKVTTFLCNRQCIKLMSLPLCRRVSYYMNVVNYHQKNIIKTTGSLLLTWIYFNSSMDKQYYPL